MQRKLSDNFLIETWENDSFESLGSKIAAEGGVVMMNQEHYAPTTRLFSLDIHVGSKDDGVLPWMSPQTRPDLTCSVNMAQQLHDRLRPPLHQRSGHHSATFRGRGLRFQGIEEKQIMFVVYHAAA